MKQKTFHFYKVLNTINGKAYIGYTGKLHPKTRWNEHVKTAKEGRGSVLHAAIRKYGVEFFQFNVIESIKSDVNTAITHEAALIKEHNTMVSDGGYNVLATAGEWTDEQKQTHSTKTKEGMTAEVRQQISQSVKQYYANGGVHAMKGKKHTAESIKKMSETTKAMVTDAQREQMRQMSLQQWQTPDKRTRVLEHIHNPTKETRQKMSAVKKGKASWNKGKENTWTTAHRSKTYIVTTPNGEILEVTNLRAFAKERGLSQGTLHMTATGRRKSHKGYSCSLV
jgi:group I intron endonuclease